MTVGISGQSLDVWDEDVKLVLIYDLDEANQALNCSNSNISFSIFKQGSEDLDKRDVSNFLSESFSQLSKVFGQREPDFPGFVFSSSNNNWESMGFILFLIEELSNLLQAVKTKDFNRVLFVGRQLFKNRDKFTDNDFMFNMSGQFTNSGGNSSSNHGSFLIAKLNEFSI